MASRQEEKKIGQWSIVRPNKFPITFRSGILLYFISTLTLFAIHSLENPR